LDQKWTPGDLKMKTSEIKLFIAQWGP